MRRSVAALGAAIAAPAIIPASALGRGGAMSPNERITMGFIGVGGQGGGHLLGGAWTYLAGGYTARKDVQVLAVCDVWKDRRERACQRVNEHYASVYGKDSYKPCEAYTDFRQVLDRSDILASATGTSNLILFHTDGTSYSMTNPTINIHEVGQGPGEKCPVAIDLTSVTFPHTITGNFVVDAASGPSCGATATGRTASGCG